MSNVTVDRLAALVRESDVYAYYTHFPSSFANDVVLVRYDEGNELLTLAVAIEHLERQKLVALIAKSEYDGYKYLGDTVALHQCGEEKIGFRDFGQAIEFLEFDK